MGRTRRTGIVVYSGNDKGWNTHTSIPELDPAFSTETLNMVVDQRGNIKFRNGYTTIGTDLSANILSMDEFITSAGIVEIIYATDTGILFRYNETTNVVTQLTTGLPTGRRYYMANYRNRIIVATRSTPKVYDGSTVADLGGSPPSFSYVATHNFRLFGLVNEDRRRIYASALNNEVSWNTTGFPSVAASDPAIIEIGNILPAADEIVSLASS